MRDVIEVVFLITYGIVALIKLYKAEVGRSRALGNRYG